jgi:septum formation protein
MLLHDKLSSKRLILASASPRRRQLLADCDIPFVVAEPFDCNEEYPPQMPSHEVAEYLSGLKSDAYPHTLAADEILLTADTVVIVDDHILGKPSSAEEAVAMLQMLSGRVHNVVTGVTIRSAERRRSFSVSSSVSFRTLTADEIDYYITRYRPFDKAGSYGIQEWIGYVAIESIEGSFFNVMGLPVQRLYVELGEFVK